MSPSSRSPFAIERSAIVKTADLSIANGERELGDLHDAVQMSERVGLRDSQSRENTQYQQRRQALRRRTAVEQVGHGQRQPQRTAQGRVLAGEIGRTQRDTGSGQLDRDLSGKGSGIETGESVTCQHGPGSGKRGLAED